MANEKKGIIERLTGKSPDDRQTEKDAKHRRGMDKIGAATITEGMSRKERQEREKELRESARSRVADTTTPVQAGRESNHTPPSPGRPRRGDAGAKRASKYTA